MNIRYSVLLLSSGYRLHRKAGPILLSFLFVASVPAALVHHWKLDGDLLDAAGGADGAMVGVQSNVAGRVGQALELDGSNYVDCGDLVGDGDASTREAPLTGEYIIVKVDN